MPPKLNPLKLNDLQLRTLTLLQALAKLPDHSEAMPGGQSVRVFNLPHPHGNHFHLGDAVVAARDASGLGIEGAWRALERKGLVTKTLFPDSIELTPAGLAYDTGPAQLILHHSDH
ncbi:MAG: hypothetical protein U1E97_02330 [Alphaproteobacteria bacterium]